MENKYLVLDVGGSSIKYALMNEECNFIEKGKVKTPLDCIENFVETIGQIYDNYKEIIEGIAISMPGIIDPKKGYTYTGGFLTYNCDKEIVKILEKRCPTRITIENDARCAALAELWKGSLKGCKHAAVIVFGTGVGGSIIIDGKVHRGKNFFAGEFSYMRNNAGIKNDVNNIWAVNNGSKALIKSFAEKKGLNPEEVDGFKIFESINSGDEQSLQILDSFANNIAAQIINIQCIFDPEKISIGGGISEQPIFIEYINKNLQEQYNSIDFYMPKIEVEKCTFCNDSNLIGALYNFKFNA